jgi:fumarylacetoacetase
MTIDFTHDPALRSWVSSANDGATDFPLQNLPYARFRRAGSHEPWRIGVAIGDQVLDLALARDAAAHWSAAEREALAPLAAGDLNTFMSAGQATWRSVRHALSRALTEGSAAQAALQSALVAQSAVEFTLPCHIGDYTDFYTGIHHATTVGKLFRPDNPLLPNYKWVPIGYHGRSSSIGVSGQAFHRPKGQYKGEGDTPQFGPCKRLDYELELGAFIGTGNALGDSLSMAQAEQSIFGVTLLNDWSARDVQAWEYQPLGPFLAKNFASTISPWIVTMDALAPYRVPFAHPESDPQPLPYLDSAYNREQGGLDIDLEVLLQSAQMSAPVTVSRSNFRHAYWTLAQMVAHHSANGCNLQPGDLLGTGTQSGPEAGQGGSLLELSNGGKQPLTLEGGEQRTFLQDGDSVVIRAKARCDGRATIGFGDCRGTVLPARG